MSPGYLMRSISNQMSRGKLSYPGHRWGDTWGLYMGTNPFFLFQASELDTIKFSFVEDKASIARYCNLKLTVLTLHGRDSTRSQETASMPISLGTFKAGLASVEAPGDRVVSFDSDSWIGKALRFIFFF